MNDEEKKAIEFVKKRTKELKKYAKRENELVYDDIILNLIEKLQKENESWKSYSEELEEEQIEKNNKNCELEFEVEKLQKENEELEEINNELEAEKNEAIRRYNFETIPKQKVKDKIEEIGEKIEYEENEKVVIYLHKQKNILQELLESEE